MASVIVENLKYRYPLAQELALKGISFKVKEGEFIGLIGANAAGKSTLCQALTGLVPRFYRGAYAGRVIVGGWEAASSDRSEMALKVGMVFQNPFTQLSGVKLTVYEEAAFGLENLGLPRSEMIRRIDWALKLLGLYRYKDRNPLTLSGGQMQRLAIAGTLALKPEVLVLDEPTSQLDPAGAEEIFQAVHELHREGVTVIMAEHKVEKLARYAERILLLDRGELIDFATPSQIFSRNDLESYGVAAPVYTRICRTLGAVDPESGLVPVTFEQACRALEYHYE
ncbi:MAG TPA: ATP-binding cassette domain-containing protein [Bacillota bacterium]